MSVANDRDRLLAALARRRELTDWTVQVAVTRAAWRRLTGDQHSEGDSAAAELTAIVHRDLPAGRGTAVVRVDPSTPIAAALEAASARAAAALGPPWHASPPAAPARVELADPAIDPTAPSGALATLAGALDAARGDRPLFAADLTVATTDHELHTQRGQRAAWRSTAATATVTLTPDAAPVTTRARRLDELDLTGALADPTSAAVALAPGTYPVALTARALLHGDRGLLEALVAQADPQLERQGLARYRAGQPLAAGADLTVHSDGTLPFGWHSAPLGPAGEPIRRFPLVVDGLAAELGLDRRAAALGGRLPNGGVRGLIVAPGLEGDLVDAQTLVIERLAWLEVDRPTGWFRAGFARAHRAGDPAQAVGPGVLRGDAIALLGRARRSAAEVATPSYRGPALWHLGAVAVD